MASPFPNLFAPLTGDPYLPAAAGVPVYAVGDCVRAGKVFDAVRGAYVAAMSIR